MVHPHTELRFVNPLIGWGVFATRLIPQGTIVWALDALDQRFTPEQAAALPAYARRLLHKPTSPPRQWKIAARRIAVNVN